jgi:ribosomal protein S18 acetylase RimI-like enzyme
MPWDPHRPTDPKYHSPEHRAQVAAHKAQLARDGYLICAAVECQFTSRVITNPNGNAANGVTAGHMPDGVTYNGPEHRKCNLHEAAVRANRRSRGIGKPSRWVV